MTSTVGFWKWVASRRAHDNPRGEFIRDVRDLLSWGMDPTGRLFIASPEGKRQYESLRREYMRSREQNEQA